MSLQAGLVTLPTGGTLENCRVVVGRATPFVQPNGIYAVALSLIFYVKNENHDPLNIPENPMLRTDPEKIAYTFQKVVEFSPESDAIIKGLISDATNNYLFSSIIGSSMTE